MLVAAIGIISEQFSIILLNGFMAFIVLAMETGYSLYTQILTISLVIGIIATAFQLWGEMMGSNGGVE